MNLKHLILDWVQLFSMKKIILKYLYIISFSVIFTQAAIADTAHFIDFSKVLNDSLAGSSAQKFLKKEFSDQATKFKKIQDSIIQEEKQIISQKKIIGKDEYEKKIRNLREKVAKLQKDRNASLQRIGKLRSQAKQELLNHLNPVIKEYMEKNKIRIVLDKKSILLGDQKLEITKVIIENLNKKVKKLSLK